VRDDAGETRRLVRHDDGCVHEPRARKGGAPEDDVGRWHLADGTEARVLEGPRGGMRHDNEADPEEGGEVGVGGHGRRAPAPVPAVKAELDQEARRAPRAERRVVAGGRGEPVTQRCAARDLQPGEHAGDRPRAVA
jgi:hypothetical protein